MMKTLRDGIAKDSADLAESIYGAGAGNWFNITSLPGRPP